MSHGNDFHRSRGRRVARDSSALPRVFVSGLGAVLLASLLVAQEVCAALIVDTGEPDDSPLFREDTGLFLGEGRAGRFTLDAAWHLDQVETKLGDVQGLGLSATLAIYDNAAGGSVPGQELFATEFINQNSETLAVAGGWEMIALPGWTLSAGTYWISFEVRPGQTMLGNLNNSGFDRLPQPLDAYAWFESGDVSWIVSSSPTDAFAVRIHASPVPLPAAWALLAAGCAALRWRRRKG